MNQEIPKFFQWLIANKLSLNVDKTKFMIFKPRRKRVLVKFRVVLNNKEIEQVKETVFLGVVLDEHLTWKSHVALVANKISKSIGIIRKSSPYLQNSSLRTLYFSLIYPYLQYCYLVWSSTYPTNLSRLIILQKRVVRLIGKKDYIAHTNPIFKELHLLKFQDIQKLQTCQFMFSYTKKIVPYNFQEMFTLNSQIHNHNTRSKTLFHIPAARTKLRQFSVQYQGPTVYNTLNEEIKQSISYVFTKKIKRQLISNYCTN